MNHCVICKKEHDLFSLKMETDEGEPYALKVCGTCWDTIAAIAKMSVGPRIAELEKKVERLLAMFPSAAERKE